MNIFTLIFSEFSKNFVIVFFHIWCKKDMGKTREPAKEGGEF